MKPAELAAVAGELDAGLHGAIVQKVYHPAPLELWLELRQPGRSTLLCASAQAGLLVADQRPESPKNASGLQQRLRKLIGGKRLERIGVDGGVVTLYFSTASVVLGERIEVRPAVATPAREPAPATADFPLARAVRPVADDGGEKKRLERHLKKLERTRAKIAEEAARGPLAEAMKRDGELLSRNLSAVARGASSVTLRDYTADGAVQREVALDPRRSPKQQVEWLFHQSKRLLRGVEIARERLRKIDSEIAAARLPPHPGPLPSRGRGSTPSLPYREYRTASGAPIWVGRGAKHNDELTFAIARPHHLWLHARGVPGAHVVIPLEKKQTVDQETLLDAAHLAFHHSDARGERTGEVSYTHVRYLKKAGAPGAVRYTRESTFWLRVEPERLKRLLET